MQTTRREVRHGRMTKNYFQGSRKAAEQANRSPASFPVVEPNLTTQQADDATRQKAIARAQQEKTEAGVSTLLSTSPFLA